MTDRPEDPAPAPAAPVRLPIPGTPFLVFLTLVIAALIVYFAFLRQVDRTEFAGAVGAQLAAASESKGPGDLQSLLRSNGTWTVDA